MLHGFGLGVSGDAGLGLTPLFGGAATGSAAAGAFWGDPSGPSGAVFFSGGAAAQSGPSPLTHGDSITIGVPGQQQQPFIAGGGGGAGVMAFFTNATSGSQVSSIFQTTTLSLGALSNLSFSFSTDNSGIWQFSISYGGGGGIILSRITTNTVAHTTGCK